MPVRAEPQSGTGHPRWGRRIVNTGGPAQVTLQRRYASQAGRTIAVCPPTATDLG